MKEKIFSIIISIILLMGITATVNAQDTSDNPTYIVQPGENLTEIAQKFNVSINDIIQINNINNSDLIIPGTELIIPGLEGITGLLTSDYVNIGESLLSLSRRHGLGLDLFTKLNPITSPNELFIGSSLVLPEKQDSSDNLISIIVNPHKSILDYAVLLGADPWEIKLSNDISSAYLAIPGEALFFDIPEDLISASLLPGNVSSIEINPLPLVQGHTAVLQVRTTSPGALNSSIGTQELVFFPDGSDNNQIAIQGIHALTNPGLIPLKITGTFENNDNFSLEQMVLVRSGGYGKEEITVEQTTIEQEIMEAEDNQIKTILTQQLPEKYWSAPFRFPVDGSLSDGTIGFSSYFGNRRSYNNGLFNGFHGGLDFSVVLNSLNIYAPAPGKVMYTGMMNIRGNATFIDHGYGIVSGYAHQAEIFVTPGEIVEAGQLIGIIGKTGRVTGPHLHWEIWANGVQVDPFDWIENTYP